LPLEFGSTFEFDEKFPLKVEKFIESREEKMYSILVDDIAL
jgi:hypothetical protein